MSIDWWPRHDCLHALTYTGNQRATIASRRDRSPARVRVLTRSVGPRRSFEGILTVGDGVKVDGSAGISEYESALVSARPVSERHHHAASWLTRPPSTPHSPPSHVCRSVYLPLCLSVRPSVCLFHVYACTALNLVLYVALVCCVYFCDRCFSWFGLFFSAPAKILAGKSVSEVTHFVLTGTININSCGSICLCATVSLHLLYTLGGHVSWKLCI